MECTNRCYSPTACEAFGYCRNLNKPFHVTRLVVPPIYLTQLTGVQTEWRTLSISARDQETAEKMADDHLNWFDDNNAIINRKPFVTA